MLKGELLQVLAVPQITESKLTRRSLAFLSQPEFVPGLPGMKNYYVSIRLKVCFALGSVSHITPQGGGL